MNSALLVLALLGQVSQLSSVTSEVLVLTTPTLMTQSKGRVAIEIQNLGPQPLFCGFTSATTVINKARKVGAGESWSLDTKARQAIYCVTSANQVTGAATVVSELRE